MKFIMTIFSIYFIIGVSVLCLVMIWWLQKKKYRNRILVFTKQIEEKISSSDLSGRIDLEVDSEFTDLTEAINRTLDLQSRSQLELSRNEKRFRKLFNDALTGNFVISADGQIILCNNAFQRILGFDSTEEAMNTNFFSLFPNQQNKNEYLHLLHEKTKIESYEHTYLRRHGGESIIVLENAVGLFNINGSLDQIQGYIVDITEHRKVESIKQSLVLEKMVSKVSSRFVGLTNINEAIDISLMDIGRYTGMSRTYLHLFEADKLNLQSYHEWSAQGVSSIKTIWLNFLLEHTPLFKIELNQHRHIVVHDLSDLPLSIMFLKEDLMHLGVKSLLVQPLRVREECYGFFGFDDSFQFHHWNDENFTLLQIFGRIFENLFERLLAEEEIKYLTFHDKLTGLFNRAYFEEEIKRLDTDRQQPLSIIIGDVNGLKLINDAFGHAQGDRMLIQMAEIFTLCCRKEDIICRWGGDEFAILLPKTSKTVVQEVCNRIRDACAQDQHGPVQLSIALGTGTKEWRYQDSQEILKEAEERMYRNKLMEGKSARHAIISSLEQSLWETDFETEAHAKRLQKYALQMGRELNLSDSQMDELQLLAALHDIGKIAILKSILMKPEKLTKDEWNVMTKHTEIGYRIAQSSTDLAPIAEAILAHHERWDGTGYPHGLKGEEIPLISRIISVVDAFDVMISGRSYKVAVSREEALEELKVCSGTQFDPNLVLVFIQMIGQSEPENDIN